MRCRCFPTKTDLREERYDDIQLEYDCGGLLFDDYPLVELVMVMLRPWEWGFQKQPLVLPSHVLPFGEG